MKTVKLSKKDISLIMHALTITESDYTVDESNPEPYRVKMQLDIEKLKDKLIKMYVDTVKFGVGNGK